MSEELRSFNYRRASMAVLILWLGGLVLESEGAHILSRTAYWISRGNNERLLFLHNLFILGAYAALLLFAAFWYFRIAKSGFRQGVLLGIVCGIGWRTAHIVENGVREVIGLPIVVRYFEPKLWLLLIGIFALTGLFMRITFPEARSHNYKPQ